MGGSANVFNDVSKVIAKALIFNKIKHFNLACIIMFWLFNWVMVAHPYLMPSVLATARI